MRNMPQSTLQQNILQELGLDAMPPKIQEDLLVKLTESALKRITLETLSRLSEEDRKEFDKIQNAKDPEKMNEFLRAKIPNYEELVRRVVDELKGEIKDTVALLKK